MKLAPRQDSSIALLRSEHLIPFIDLLRRAGTPVEKELCGARLPAHIEEHPDSYISIDLVFRFLSKCAHSEGMENIGFEAGWGFSYDDFGPTLKDALQLAPTLKSGIFAFARLVTLEDSEFHCTLLEKDGIARISIRQYVPLGHDSRLAEWQNLKAIIELARKYLNPQWLPEAIGLQSRVPVPPEVSNYLGNTRILPGQPVTFVEFPGWMLAETRFPFGDRDFAPGDSPATQPTASISFGDDLVTRLGAVLLPYLSSGHPPIGLAAEIAGVSVRGLQRRLCRLHTNYSNLIEGIRFQQALHLLRHSELKVLDIALLLGYQDASNFSRAIRRISGSSPRELRQPGYVHGKHCVGMK